ncbi:MAG: sulfite exporter TauE/SafE family protein [Candidatus Hydrogenedentes bacterium]|nr:sulfite exporter TauE/SafE family protein [Candidatus Hydrogenedentota bacterium]
MTQYLWLVPLGFVVGAYGTLIGAGGGFVLVPVLLILYPRESPEIITSISLAVVFFNALSGSVAYARMRRIDYRSGILFSAASVPGAVLGALLTSHIPRQAFDLVFGALMTLAAIYLLIRPVAGNPVLDAGGEPRFARRVVEANGVTHSFSYNPVTGVVISFGVGFISSLLGIGGGIIHVPALVGLLNFPVHVATATSHFILAAMALTGTAVHIGAGTFTTGFRRTLLLSIGVLLGAQLGAMLSSRMRGTWIIRSLAIVLGLVGVRILWLAL